MLYVGMKTRAPRGAVMLSRRQVAVLVGRVAAGRSWEVFFEARVKLVVLCVSDTLRTIVLVLSIKNKSPNAS